MHIRRALTIIATALALIGGTAAVSMAGVTPGPSSPASAQSRQPAPGIRPGTATRQAWPDRWHRRAGRQAAQASGQGRCRVYRAEL